MSRTLHEWSKEAYFGKAQIYAESMADHEDSDWRFGLWSAFVMEMLVRASVAARSPVLNADSSDWNNLLYALGGTPKKGKFVAKSASANEMVNRLLELSPDFSREHANFCTAHFARRNSELHSGSFPFENLGSSTWIPLFYTVCQVLLEEIDESLESLFGVKVAEQAKEDIEAFKDDTAQSVKGIIAAHAKVWNEKSEEDKADLTKRSESVNLRTFGHRVSCPACSCVALVVGKPVGEPKQSIVEEGILERMSVKPDSFECIACGLKITGYSKLLAAGLGDQFVSTSRYDALEYFEVDLDEHFRGLLDDDNNEPF